MYVIHVLIIFFRRTSLSNASDTTISVICSLFTMALSSQVGLLFDRYYIIFIDYFVPLSVKTYETSTEDSNVPGIN